MILVIAEKPSVARDIARVLGCKEKGEGFLKSDSHIVSWAVGHLVTLVEPDELDEKYKKWRMEDLPILPEHIPTKVISQTKSQFKILKDLMARSDVQSLICATDAGREGELIFRLIYEKAGCKKPVQRLWISSMTDEAIKEGFAGLKPSGAYDGLYASAKSRSVADWLVGMNASRAFTLRYNVLLSIGRVQTPTLALLVKRQHEIDDFVPQEYFTVTADFGDYTGTWLNESAPDEKTASRIATQAEADAIVQAVKGQHATVKSVQQEEKRDLPPQLFDLTSLQREANKKYGFTADKTLKITQELYEKWKAVTYPRTDSRYLPMDMIGRTKLTLEKLPAAYKGYVQGLPLRDGKLPVSKRTFDDSKVSDHHAIIPTPQTCPIDKLPEDEKKIFDLIARRTIAAFYPAFVYDSIRVITLCREHSFKSTGRVVKEQGWKAVYDSDQAEEKPKSSKKKTKDAESEEKVLPPLHEGNSRVTQKATAKKESTKPPSPHTDASILYAMENAGRDLEDEELREQMKGSGLGTPATRAAIIERLIQVGYAKRKGKALSATEKGMQLIDIVPNELSSAELTGKWELALSNIAESKGDAARFMDGIRRMSAYLVDFAVKTDKKGNFDEEGYRGKGKKYNKSSSAASDKALPDVTCPLCGKGVKESPRAFGCTDWKNGCPFTLWKDCLTRYGGPALSDKLITLLLKNKSVRGSTGTIFLTDTHIGFIRNGEETPACSIPVRYVKK